MYQKIAQHLTDLTKHEGAETMQNDLKTVLFVLVYVHHLKG